MLRRSNDSRFLPSSLVELLLEPEREDPSPDPTSYDERGKSQSNENEGPVDGDNGSEEEDNLGEDGEEVLGVLENCELGRREESGRRVGVEHVGEVGGVLEDESDVLFEEVERVRTKEEARRLLPLLWRRSGILLTLLWSSSGKLGRRRRVSSLSGHSNGEKEDSPCLKEEEAKGRWRSKVKKQGRAREAFVLFRNQKQQALSRNLEHPKIF